MAVSTEKYFNEYFKTPINFTPNEVDGVIAYFLKRGFEKQAAVNISSTLLQQADIDGVNIFQLLDTLKGVTDVQLNNVIAQILNLNRPKSSKIGFRTTPLTQLFDQRNIII